MVWWALKYLGVDERIVSVIKAMYEDASTKVRVHGESMAFGVRMTIHQTLFSAHGYWSLCWRPI